MKAKIILTVLMLYALLAVFASAQMVNQGITQNAGQTAVGANANQNINQAANQQAFATNNTTINQTLNQRARQNATGFGNASQTINQAGGQFAAGGNASQNINQMGAQFAAGRNVSQGINQTGTQFAAGGNVTQNIYQKASQTTWNVQNYFTTEQNVQVTSDQRTVIASRAENFLTLYPQSRAFVMPLSDFQTIVNQRSQEIVVLDVSAQGNAPVPAGFSGVIRVPLANLASSISMVPSNVAVAVISDNDVNSAVAMTMLRMYGYNAWILPVGNCGWQSAAVMGTGTAVSSGLTTQTQTVNGVTTGQTTGSVARANY